MSLPRSSFAVTTLAASMAAMPAQAQTSGAVISGHAALGTRNVSVDGSINKFREDINLNDGVRLMDAAFSFLADPDADSPVDRIDFDARHLGGDPFETIHFGAQKFGVYTLKLDRRRSQYFYDDIIVPPALASITGSTGGDFHRFDFERTRDRAALDITVSPATRISLGLDRHRRIGDSETTLDIQRDEFELERPLDESMNAANIAVQHSWDKVTLVYERDGREFENAIEAFLPGASTGINDTDPADLLFFSLDQSYDYDSTGNTLRVLVRPTTRFDLQAFWREEDLDLHMDARERGAGTTFAGDPFTSDLSGSAAIGRDIDLQELSFGYLLNERIRLIGEVRRHALEQQGNLVFDATPGAVLWDMETLGTQFGVEYAASQNIVFSAGLSQESREVLHSEAPGSLASAPEVETDRSGFFASVSLEPADGLTLLFSVEDDDIDDPYTLASPTGSRRYRARASYRWDNGLVLNASLRQDQLENDSTGWNADTDQANVRLSYDVSRLSLSVGLTQIDLGRAITQNVVAGSRQDTFVIDYDADADLVDGSIRWRFGDRISVGGYYAQYENDGSYPIERDDFRAFIEIDVGTDYLVRAAWRDVEYREDGFDDYDAQLLELALDVRW